MTQHKHLKSVVRQRQARTGESYSIARKHVLDRLGRVGLTPVAELEAHDQHCMAVRFTEDGSQLLTGGFKGQCRLWSTADWSRSGELAGHTQSVNAFALRGERVVTVSSDRTVRLWNLAERAEIAVLGRHGKQVTAADLDGDDGSVWTGGFDGKLRRFSLDGGEVGSIRVGERIASLAAHPHRPWVATGLVGPKTVVWDHDGGSVARLPAPGDATVSVRWSSDGQFLMAAGPAGAVEVWSVDPWETVRNLEIPGKGMLPIALTADSTLMAVGWERHLGLWRADGDEPAVTIDGLPKGVYTLDFSPDGSLLAQGGADGRVRVWRVR